MKNSLITFLAAMLLIVGLSCSAEYPCSRDAELRYAFVGFEESDVETFILKKYLKNTATLIDSTIFNEENPVRFSREGDTLRMVAYSGSAVLKYENDYELIFPTVSKSFKISDMVQTQSYGRNAVRLSGITKEYCVNPISSCRINGQIIDDITAGKIYFHK